MPDSSLPVIPIAARETAIEHELLRITNLHRSTLSGISATQLVVDPILDRIASWKASDCSAGMYMQHDQPAVNGHPAFTISDRFIEGGWPSSMAWGENIAYGLQSAQDLLDAWLSDIGHRQNVEGPWNVCAFAVVTASNGLRFGVQDFGYKPGQPTPPPPSVPPPPLTPKPGEEWRKKGAHNFVVMVDEVIKGTPKIVRGHRPGDTTSHLQWTLATFRRNFEPRG